MSVSDPLADMLTKIRNASSARFEKVDITTSKLKLEVVKILKNEGYIKNFKKTTKSKTNLRLNTNLPD
jgi:small subunit ribosomal protein S8